MTAQQHDTEPNIPVSRPSLWQHLESVLRREGLKLVPSNEEPVRLWPVAEKVKKVPR